ncbi:hypothetical protein GA0115261_105048 [Streptomyces sp. OspMP-M43]|nr:hypothetical protein GA0115261_105048 [Streptomyces sp. OspMP-M43]
MHLFGITSYTAIHYVRADHPEHFVIDHTPRPKGLAAGHSE